jgi:hypothetical protein
MVLDLDPNAVLTARLETTDAAARKPPLKLPTYDHGDQVSQDLLARVQQAAHHLAAVQQAYRETLVAARQAGASWRQLAAAARLSPSRIRQLLAKTSGTVEPASPVVRYS